MHYFGIFLGWLLVAGFIWGGMKYLLRAIYQKKIKELPADSQLRKNYSAFLDVVVRTHQYVPLYLITVLLIHFMLEMVHQGFYFWGFLAGCLMLTMVVLGTYGTIVKSEKISTWFYAHRTIAVLLLIISLIHIISVWGLPTG
jgi:hypothetical protein